MTEPVDTGEEALTPEQQQDRQDAYADAAGQLALGIGLGLFPLLGQAIDAYDSVCALIGLAKAETPAQKDDAYFDTMLSLIGWVPGPGDGVKKSLRIVNSNPERYAPILFDLLREVLVRCDIKTSPEVLLDKLFNEAAIKRNLGEIQNGIRDSSSFKQLPKGVQQTVLDSLQWTSANVGLLVGVVQRRLTKWKRRKPNSSARGEIQGRRRTDEPGKRDAETGTHGGERGKDGMSQESVKGQLATASLDQLMNATTGVMGEHIADYHCYENLKWGSGWDGHDKGEGGTWTTPPGKNVSGKLSNRGKLFRLSAGSHGIGIDAVWRADSHNEGKPYAIVEAKASAAQVKSTSRKARAGRKPAITSKLNVSNLKPKPEDLLEPAIGSEGSGKSGGGKGGGGKKGGGKTASRASSGSKATGQRADAGGPIVQMSEEWIEKNIRNAVGRLEDDVRLRGYSRHLFYVPIFTPSAAQHAQAVLSGGLADPTAHTDHNVQFHYNEAEVKGAVNKKKSALRSQRGQLSNLKHEL